MPAETAAPVNTVYEAVERIAEEQPKKARPPAPPISLALPPDSSLVLVETRHAASAPATEEAPVQRARRARPPRVSAPDEPLQIVETRKE